MNRIRACVGLAAAFASAVGVRAGTPADVAVVQTAEWSAGDSIRDGAGEFAVFLRVAQLQRAHHAAGLIVIGDRNGILRCGGEVALRRVVLTGVVVARQAPAGQVSREAGALFVDANGFDAGSATRILARCLERFGAPPAVANPDQPTASELAQIRTHLEKFQRAFAQSERLVAAQ